MKSADARNRVVAGGGGAEGAGGAGASAVARDQVARQAPRAAAPVLREFSRSLPMLLLRGHQTVMAEFRPLLRKHGLTEQQWRVLRCLDTALTLRMSRVAELTLISAPSLTRIVRDLERSRLIGRSIDKGDQRAACIRLRAAGRKLIDTIAPFSEQRYADIAARYGERELQLLYGLLDRLPETLGQSRSAAARDGAVQPPHSRVKTQNPGALTTTG